MSTISSIGATPAQSRGTGKRKTSVARVILRPGDGKTWINGKTLDQYFPRLLHRKAVMAPLEVTELSNQYDLRVRVHGGGPSGQAGAVRHGVARALVAPSHGRLRAGPDGILRHVVPEGEELRADSFAAVA